MADSDRREATTDQPSSAAPVRTNTGDTSFQVAEGVASAISADRITSMQLNSRADESAASSGSAGGSSDRKELTVSSSISAVQIVSIDVAESAGNTVAQPAASAGNDAGTSGSNDSTEG